MTPWVPVDSSARAPRGRRTYPLATTRLPIEGRLLWVVPAILACAQTPEPAPKPVDAAAPSTLVDTCPEAAVVVPGLGTASSALFLNRLGRDVLVTMDRCSGHVRVTELDADQERVAALPKPSVRYPEGLRFHVYASPSGEWLGSLDAGRERVDAGIELSPSTLDRTRPAPESESVPDYDRLGRTARQSLGETQAISVFAVNSLGVLGLVCDAGQPELLLSTGRRLPTGDVSVSLSYRAEELAHTDAAEIVRSVQDAVRLPTEWLPMIQEALRKPGQGTVIEVDDAELGVVAHHFFGNESRRFACSSSHP